MPASALREKQHPAKRSFQAIRIAVNDELGAVRQGMEAAIDHLKPGGRLAVITFHSLEDRIVKRFMKAEANPDDLPKNLPLTAAQLPQPRLKIVGKPVKASAAEVAANPRSRSAVMRVAEKLAA